MLKRTKILLDASAVIVLLKQERGYKDIEDLLNISSISTVNLCEVVSVLSRGSVIESEIDDIISDLIPNIIPFTEEIAITAGKLIKQTQSSGLSLGDRACIATGIRYDLEIYTADKAWSTLDLDCKIIQVR